MTRLCALLLGKENADSEETFEQDERGENRDEKPRGKETTKY